MDSTKQQLSLGEKIGIGVGILVILAILAFFGNQFLQKGNLEQALEDSKVGDFYYRQQDYENAEKLYLQSLATLQTLNYGDGVAEQYGKLGLLYVSQQLYPKATDMYTKSIEAFMASSNISGVANQYGNLAIINALTQNFEQAEHLFQESIKLYKTANDTHGLAEQYNNLSKLYITHRKKMDEVLKLLESSEQLSQAPEHVADRAAQYANLGKLYQTAGALEQAEQWFNKSLQGFQTIGHKNAEIVQKFLTELKALQEKASVNSAP